MGGYSKMPQLKQSLIEEDKQLYCFVGSLGKGKEYFLWSFMFQTLILVFSSSLPILPTVERSGRGTCSSSHPSISLLCPRDAAQCSETWTQLVFSTIPLPTYRDRFVCFPISWNWVVTDNYELDITQFHYVVQLHSGILLDLSSHPKRIQHWDRFSVECGNHHVFGQYYRKSLLRRVLAYFRKERWLQPWEVSSLNSCRSWFVYSPCGWWLLTHLLEDLTFIFSYNMVTKGGFASGEARYS